MNQAEKRQYLIRYLIDEQSRYGDITVPADETGQKQLLRSLLNVRMPGNIEDGFLSVQDEYLKEEIRKKGIMDYTGLTPVGEEAGRYHYAEMRCDSKRRQFRNDRMLSAVP